MELNAQLFFLELQDGPMLGVIQDSSTARMPDTGRVQL